MPEDENNRKLTITCSLFSFQNCHLLWLGSVRYTGLFLAFCGKLEMCTLPEIKKIAFFTQLNHHGCRRAGYLAIIP